MMHFSSAIASVTDSEAWQIVNKLLLAVGHSGVDLFFVISGAIMYIVSKDASANNLDACFRFSTHRIMRIYPLYFLTFAFSFFIVFRGNYTGGSLQMIEELTLISTPAQHPVAWTLSYEIRFYLIVATILLLFRRNLDVALCVWAVIQIGLTLAAKSGLVGFSCFSYILMTEFSAGLLVGALITRKIVDYPLLLLCICVVWWLSASFFVYFDANLVLPYRHLLYGVPAAMLLYALVSLENTRRFTPSRAAVYVGGLSYSIYLWHFPLMNLFLRGVSGHKEGGVFGFFFLLGLIGATGIVSFFSYHFVERPAVLCGHLFFSRSLDSASEASAPAR